MRLRYCFDNHYAVDLDRRRGDCHAAMEGQHDCSHASFREAKNVRP
jgi:hypothetical protein